MEKEIFILKVYNTLTKQYEDVVVTKKVYDTYRRTEWNIKDNDESFYDHEIQISGLIGGENENYENFHEFVDEEETPENIVVQAEIIKSLRECIDELESEEQELVDALYNKGVSEREYSRITGIPQRTINHRKERILEKLRKNKKISK